MQGQFLLCQIDWTLQVGLTALIVSHAIPFLHRDGYICGQKVKVQFARPVDFRGSGDQRGTVPGPRTNYRIGVENLHPSRQCSLSANQRSSNFGTCIVFQLSYIVVHKKANLVLHWQNITEPNLFHPVEGQQFREV